MYKLITWLFIALFLVAELAFLAFGATSTTCQLAWDASPSSNVTGYNIYWGQTPNGPYPNKIDAGNNLTTIVTIPVTGELCFVATAYNTKQESVNSTELDCWILNASSDANSTISPSGYFAVTAGQSQVFIITPASGYDIIGITVDGVSVPVTKTYVLSAIAAGHTIVVTSAASLNPPGNLRQAASTAKAIATTLSK
jgi:hypothetical protein